MEAHPAHNSLLAKAKMEAMDVLTWVWMGNNGFIYPLAPLCSNFHFFFHRASLSLLSCRSCPFHSGRMPRNNDTYSVLWRYLQTIDEHDDGIQTYFVSRVLLEVGQSTFTYCLPLFEFSSLLLMVQVIIDFLISCLFLYIPYHTYPLDLHVSQHEEGGICYASPTVDLFIIREE